MAVTNSTLSTRSFCGEYCEDSDGGIRAIPLAPVLREVVGAFGHLSEFIVAHPRGIGQDEPVSTLTCRGIEGATW